MPGREASLADTPYGRYVTSEGWFVLNLGEALAVRNEEKGGVAYPIESQEHQFPGFGVHLRVLRPGDPNSLYHAEGVQEGFFVLSGECTLVVDEEERQLRQWDYFHCPPDTPHVLVGAGDGPCSILMIGAVPTIRFAIRSARWQRSTARRSTRRRRFPTRRMRTGPATISRYGCRGRPTRPRPPDKSSPGPVMAKVCPLSTLCRVHLSRRLCATLRAVRGGLCGLRRV